MKQRRKTWTKKVMAATMCSIEESRDDSNKMKKKGTRTTEAEVNF